MEAKEDNIDKFWDAFEAHFEKTKKEHEAADGEQKNKIVLNCAGFVFPDIRERFEGREFPFIVDFRRAQFPGDASFSSAQFASDAYFGRAQFTGAAGFRSAQFTGAQFSGDANFWGARFLDGAEFGKAHFSSEADFRGVQFGNSVRFCGAQFMGYANFQKAQFSSYAFFGASHNGYFWSAQFSGDADFSFAHFKSGAHFRGATFSGRVNFPDTQFSGETEFEGAKFSGLFARFSRARFSGDANFLGAHFSGDAGFNRAKFSGDVKFSDAQFSGAADFEKARFTGAANFSSALFSGDADFGSAKFSSIINFRGTVFSRGVSFLSTELLGPANFNKASFSDYVNFFETLFLYESDFSNVRFENNVNFSGVIFNNKINFEYAKLTQAKFSKLFDRRKLIWLTTDIRGLNFSYSTIGEFAQTTEYGNDKITRLKPVGSADFTDVKYNAHNEYLRLILYSLRFRIFWLIKRTRKFVKKDPKLTAFRPYKYLRSKFIGVDTSAVDWSKNPRLGRDIRYQQFLHEFWNRGPFYKVLYFLWWLTSRCGESFFRWVFCALILVAFFGVCYAGYPAPGFLPDFLVNILNTIRPYFSMTLDNPFDPYYLSAITFTTLGLGNIKPLNLSAQIFVVAEVMIGFTMLGALISFFANKLVRRE
jgi:uncharacterized protein YjbI with pentapeptide repeats